MFTVLRIGKNARRWGMSDLKKCSGKNTPYRKCIIGFYIDDWGHDAQLVSLNSEESHRKNMVQFNLCPMCGERLNEAGVEG